MSPIRESDVVINFKTADLVARKIGKISLVTSSHKHRSSACKVSDGRLIVTKYFEMDPD